MEQRLNLPSTVIATGRQKEIWQWNYFH